MLVVLMNIIFFCFSYLVRGVFLREEIGFYFVFFLVIKIEIVIIFVMIFLVFYKYRFKYKL